MGQNGAEGVEMSLWLYKCNNLPKAAGYYGDWDWFFEQAQRSTKGTATWGGPGATNQPAARKLALSIKPGQQLLCWQRWGQRPDYDIPPGVDAAAVGVVELVKKRPRADPGAQWVLKPVERFERPVPLLEYRSSSDLIDGIFRNPRQMGTFVELTGKEEQLVKRLCGLARGGTSDWRAAAVPDEDVDSKSGAGFGDAASNRAVEKAAVRFVTRSLESDGWKVISVESKNVGHDLVARRKKVKRHIEVKGVKGSKPDFIITAGEARAALRDSDWEAWVVTSALSKSPKAVVFPGADLIQLYKLKPISYRAVRR